MGLSVYLLMVLVALFGLAAPVFSRRLPPAAAAWLLSGGGLLAAAASTASLVLLGFTLVAQTPVLAATGRWSDITLRQADPVAAPVAVGALVALAVVTINVGAATRRRLIAVRDAYRLAAALPAPGGELAVIDSPDCSA